MAASGFSGSSSNYRFHLISSLQVGADRGALLGVDDARTAAAAAGHGERVTTGGFAPLGFKCDDYIQESDIDAAASPSIEKEKEWIDVINESVRGLIERFNVAELPNAEHKVKFKAKDLANADACDVIVGFRAPVPASGAGTEQTVNYGVFGTYAFVEQFRHGEEAGGALQRAGFISQPGWPAESVAQVVHHDECGTCLEFARGTEYSVLGSFAHSTPKDEAKSAAKGKDCFQMKALAQADLLGQQWSPRAAKRSAMIFTLTQDPKDDVRVATQLAAFLQRSACTSAGMLKIMITGATEGIFPGIQDRVQAIFRTAFTNLLVGEML